MNKYSFFLLLLVFISCKNDVNKNSESKASKLPNTETILDKIAKTYGIENWTNVNTVKFTFVVNPGEDEQKREWTWMPKSNKVTLHQNDNLKSYNRDKLDEDYVKIDKAFINDSFWLLFPFHLVWDNFDYEVVEGVMSPLSKFKSTKIVVKYPEDGGYTPGDKYDVYINQDYQIVEWAYYPGGQENPALINTFEDFSVFNGISVSMLHRNPETDFLLTFRDVSFE